MQCKSINGEQTLIDMDGGLQLHGAAGATLHRRRRQQQRRFLAAHLDDRFDHLASCKVTTTAASRHACCCSSSAPLYICTSHGNADAEDVFHKPFDL